MSDKHDPAAITASEVPPRPSSYPSQFVHVVEGREKRALGDVFGLRSFGVNLTRLSPGSATALLHCHSVQDEFVYVLDGEPTLVTDDGETVLAPGMCAGFRGGRGAHQLVNRTADDVVLLEVGDRLPGDSVSYPADDLKAELTGKGWVYQRKDGTPY